MSNETKCACVSLDAETCIRRRYGRSYIDELEEPNEHDHDRCECVCHEPDEESFDVY